MGASVTLRRSIYYTGPSLQNVKVEKIRQNDSDPHFNTEDFDSFNREPVDHNPIKGDSLVVPFTQNNAIGPGPNSAVNALE